MKIEWRHFAMLDAIRRTGSLTAAARRLALTQSAASHQVREAERRLGVALLVRRGRGVVLTRAGETIADAAASCAPVLEGAVARAWEIGLGNAPRLRLAHGPQDGLGWAADLYAALAARPEPLQLDLIACEEGTLIERVRAGRAELALAIGEQSFGDLVRCPVGEDELVCLLPAGHALAGRRRVEAEAVARETYFAHSLTPQHGFEFERFFRPAGHLPAHVSHVGVIATIAGLVRRGAGLSIQPRSVIAPLLGDRELIVRPLAPHAVRLPWYLHARMDDPLLLDESGIDEIASRIAPHLAAAQQVAEKRAVRPARS